MARSPIKRKTASADTSATPQDAPKVDSLKDDVHPMDTVTLASLGTYMFFDHVDTETVKPLCEFLIKANCVMPTSATLTVFISSPGGGLYDGFGVIDLMDISRLKIQTVAVGAVQSMGALMFTAGTRGHRLMSRNSYMMTHQFADTFEGKYHELVAARKHNDELHQRLVEHFVKRTTMTQKQVKDVLLSPSDKYLSAQECLKYGLCDVIKDPWSDVS